ncbi:MAG: hypothetical protein IJN42_07365 [Clostridia bacterium]|nr:hypothetical protein [Clostridia bacterium]
MEFFEYIEEIIELLQSADGTFESLAAIITGIAALFSSALSVAGLAILLITALVSLVISLVYYLGRAIPTYAIAKKMNCSLAWLVWIPVFQDVLCVFVLYRISGKEDFTLLDGKFSIKQGNLVMLGYTLLYFFGGTIVTIIIALLNTFPVVGQVAGLLTSLAYLVPPVAMGIIEYVYLRDVLSLFKTDIKTVQTHSFIIAILDMLITAGFARSVYLFTLRKSTPVPAPTDRPIEVNAQ